MLPSLPPALAGSTVPRRLRPLAVLLVLALAAGLLAACGSDGEGGSNASSTPDKILAETFGAGHSIKSGNLDVVLGLTAKGIKELEKPVSLKLTGPFQSTGKGKLPNFDFDLTVDNGGQTFTAGATSTGKQGFLNFEGTDYLLPDSIYSTFAKGFEQAASDNEGKKDSTTLSALGIHPRAWLKNARSAGDEDVGGTLTHHIAADIDVEKFLDDLDSLLGKAGQLGAGSSGVPTGIPATTKTIIQQSVQKATFDVWSGAEDGTLRRLAIDITFDVPEAARSKAAGLESGQLKIDVTIADLNKAQDIAAPASSKPLSELSSKLRSLGAGSSGSSGSSGGSGSSGSGSSGRAADYGECLQQAGSDVAKIRDCGKLLGQ